MTRNDGSEEHKESVHAPKGREGRKTLNSWVRLLSRASAERTFEGGISSRLTKRPLAIEALVAGVTGGPLGRHNVVMTAEARRDTSYQCSPSICWSSARSHSHPSHLLLLLPLSLSSPLSFLYISSIVSVSSRREKAPPNGRLARCDWSTSCSVCSWFIFSFIFSFSFVLFV